MKRHCVAVTIVLICLFLISLFYFIVHLVWPHYDTDTRVRWTRSSLPKQFGYSGGVPVLSPTNAVVFDIGRMVSNIGCHRYDLSVVATCDPAKLTLVGLHPAQTFKIDWINTHRELKHITFRLAGFLHPYWQLYGTFVVLIQMYSKVQSHVKQADQEHIGNMWSDNWQCNIEKSFIHDI